MSIAQIMLLFVFLGFFLFVMPVAIYLFARFFPERVPTFIGFPEDSSRTRHATTAARSDDPSVDP